jgi:hypothetical protein
MIRKFALSLAVLAGMILQFALPASAEIGVGAFAPSASLIENSSVQEAQFVWGGRNYCWYNSAWRGPGWYWCGYAWRRGIGWGGAAGWHGWRHAGVVHRHHGVHHRPVHRPGHHRPVNRPGHQRPVHRPGHNRPGHGGGGHRGGGHRGGGRRH